MVKPWKLITGLRHRCTEQIEWLGWAQHLPQDGLHPECVAELFYVGNAVVLLPHSPEPPPVGVDAFALVIVPPLVPLRPLDSGVPLEVLRLNRVIVLRYQTLSTTMGQ